MISLPPHLRIDLPLDDIALLCRLHHVAELSIFGSVLRDDFRPDSDIDFLVVFEDDRDYGPWMSNLTDFQEALAQILHRSVDVVPRSQIEHSENYIRRKHILDSARTVYVA